MEFFNNYPILEIPKDFLINLKNIKDYKETKIKELDYIAKIYYGDVDYWWVITLYNDIINPFEVDLDIIKVPNFLEVQNIISDFKIQKELNENI